MRTRHSTGGVRKQRGRWIGMWYADGKRQSRVVGSIRDMTKSKAREEFSLSAQGEEHDGEAGERQSRSLSPGNEVPESREGYGKD